ncbi:MAG: trypsin-like peptidase domain-containing protein [Rhodospirillaceae bacterium]|nr:trypsin-like peptidase domain-containing protein [Rhodospirillaceae bacterium]MYH35370.1 trypsin-like peptidase domain-containing protein [Rhodospirillaceae bacterium]MYK16360.1 trypsin-like peptidase domain-containing protein [Rhodospirillaceae bacterium]MYK58981.1 trypsin-like peptidase domain-containing protein [Rhodospirillaceae bacterium]
MRRTPFIAILIVVIAGLADLLLPDDGRQARDENRMRRPDPGQFVRRGDAGRREAWKPPAESGGSGGLQAPSASDPAFSVAIPTGKSNSIGTAFSLDRRGVWMTARHVVDGCARVLIVTGPRRGVRVRRTYIHPKADLAVLQTRGGAPAVAFTQQTLRRGQTGYHFGYPRGEPAAIQSTLIGRRRMRSVGRYSVVEPVVAWADRVRVPDSYGGLGGISGGPAMDGRGEIIGVTVAGSKRRGRIFTTALTSIAAALERSGAAAERGGGRRGAIDGRNFAEIGAGLRKRLTVALVYCAA